MGDNEKMSAFADAIGNYVWRRFIAPKLGRCLRFYRAVVTVPAAGGKITVQRPFDAPLALPFVGSAAGLQAGDQCVVLVLGDDSNSIVLGNGTLSNL